MALYNEGKKLDFIKSSNGNANNITNLFERAEYKEKQLGKDLSDFTVVEIIDMYKSLGVSSVDALYNMNNLFQRYTAWALSQQMVRDGQNHYDELSDYELYKSLINPIRHRNQFITREELISDCEQMPNPVDRFIALAIFEGIGVDPKLRYDEFKNLKTKDFVDGKVNLPSGRSFNVSKELIKYAKESEETYDVCPYLPNEYVWNEGVISENIMFQEDDDNIIKRMNNTKNDEVDNGRKIRVEIAKMKAVFGKEVYSPAILRRSGLIEFIQKLAKGRTDFVDVIKENMGVITYRYGTIPNIWKFVSKYEDLLKGV